MIRGVCDPLLSVLDLAALLEARLANGAPVTLDHTSRKVLGRINGELSRSRAELLEGHKEVETQLNQLKAMATQLDRDRKELESGEAVRKQVEELENLKRKKGALELEMAQERKEHFRNLAKQGLPEDFDPDRFPEAEQVAVGAVERWKETLEDPNHLVSGDFLELEKVLIETCQKLAWKVADRYRGLVDV